MPEPPKFETALDSDSRRSPLRVAFVTRRTSPNVKTTDDALVMTWPETLFRAAVAIEAVTIALVLLALFWDAPLEALADPMRTPNPAKAPWYFLGLQELLHYFPPVIAGVLIPTLVIIALVIIPYFNINVEAEGIWLRNKKQRVRIVAIVVAALCALCLGMEVWVILVPTLFVAGFLFLAAFTPQDSPRPFRRWLVSKPLPFWIMTWFLIEASVLTIVGTFFRGAGWAWVLPWGAQ